jgi:hypothetical protein
MTEIVALGSTVCIGTMRSGEREGSMACRRQISHGTGIACPQGAELPHSSGVRGHPWAMCCSLIGETFCPGRSY